MDLMCRLCCSTMFVNNDIFDEENALYLKMSLYLPIKVFKNDGLPNKICDRCSCKVNDLYQFCNETIEVQSRLRAILLSNSIVEDSVDLTRVKENSSPPLINKKLEQSTQTDENASQNEPPATDQSATNIFDNITVKEEPISSQIKEESSNEGFDQDFSDDDDISLISLKKQKKEKVCNGVAKRSKKKKGKLKDWLMHVLPKDTGIKVLENGETSDNQLENKDLSYSNSKDFNVSIDMSNIKQEITESVYNCCICLGTCYSRADMVQHYKSHVTETLEVPPPAPAPPDKEPFRCARCNKCVSASEWSAHWMRHWTRDLRPYRCGLCEKTFRDPYQILKHGLSAHGSGASPPAGETAAQAQAPRFLCDGCPLRFVYMRCLTAHRDLAHPELRARPLALRCPTCARTFAHLNSLRRHLRSHSGERNFLCNVCGKALSSREHLKFHIRIHTGDKPNVCGTCGKGFVKKCNLTLHERVHSGEKPHVCSHCGKAFSQRSTLVIHERYHSGARPYVCSLCGRGFVAKGLLSMHLKSTCI